MLGRPQEYTGPWGKTKRVSWDEKTSSPYKPRQRSTMSSGPSAYYGFPSSTGGLSNLRAGVTRQTGGGFTEQKSARQTTEDLPWFMQGEGGGMLGRRRSEVEGIDPQEMYGLAAPSVRKTTEGITSSIEEEAARTGRSPAMVAMMKKNVLGGELEGLGAAAGQAAAGAYGMKEQAKAGLFQTEAGLGQAEMAGRRGVTRSELPRKAQHKAYQREDKLRRESQNRLQSFWDSYGL